MSDARPPGDGASLRDLVAKGAAWILGAIAAKGAAGPSAKS